MGKVGKKGRRIGHEPQGCRDTEKIASALEQFITKPNFLDYTKKKETKYRRENTMKIPEVEQTMRKLKTLSSTWNFVPAAITESVYNIGKDLPVSWHSKSEIKQPHWILLDMFAIARITCFPTMLC